MKNKIRDAINGLNGIGPLNGSSVKFPNDELILLPDLAKIIDEEVPFWNKQLNDIVGISSFLLAVQTAEMNYGFAWALAGLLFFILVAVRSTKGRTKYFSMLRCLNGDFNKMVNEAISHRYFKLNKSLSDSPVYWIGCLCLFLSMSINLSEFIIQYKVK